MERYEPRTPATKRALLKTIFNMKSAKKVDEIEKNILKLEETYKRYELMSPDKLPDDIKTVIMIELCTPENACRGKNGCRRGYEGHKCVRCTFKYFRRKSDLQCVACGWMQVMPLRTAPSP